MGTWDEARGAVVWCERVDHEDEAEQRPVGGVVFDVDVDV
jgi:hypothetical protein